MKFSIRDLFLVTMIAALALGWTVDRLRLAEDERRREKAWFDPPPAGSRQAMDFFLRENASSSGIVPIAANLCFVPGAPASRYSAVFSQANRSSPSETSQLPGAVTYSFWSDLHFVDVTVAGDPLVIVDTKTVCKY
jgi:hypothetical protein